MNYELISVLLVWLQGEIVSLRSDNVRLNELVVHKNMSQSTVGLSYQQQQQQQQQLHNDARSASVQHITLCEPASNIGSRIVSKFFGPLPRYHLREFSSFVVYASKWFQLLAARMWQFLQLLLHVYNYNDLQYVVCVSCKHKTTTNNG